MLIFKGAAIVLILLTAYAGAGFSFKIAGSKGRDRIFSLGTALAGGIFLGTGMLHMLPDTHEGIRTITGNYNIPWVSLFACSGFLLILFIQRVLLYEEKVLEGPIKHKVGRKFSPHILMISLSVHSLISGIALGTEEVLQKAIVLLIAILAYKLSAVFTLEVNLHRSGLHKIPNFRKATLLFGVITPLGILIGSALTALLSVRAEQFTTVAFDALTAGSFLYIALSDILDEEFMLPKDRLLKFALVTFGFAAMALITLHV